MYVLDKCGFLETSSEIICVQDLFAMQNHKPLQNLNKISPFLVLKCIMDKFRNSKKEFEPVKGFNSYINPKEIMKIL